ncbi:hypothetical protein EAF04_001743 [Stromatinia cepivora]|nr:hypothetical protein EAF04_001743 [Stromatinia cepivora]
MQFLEGIDISDAEAIRRVVRAATLPPIEESLGYPPRRRLDTSTGPLTLVERRAVDDIEKLWMLGKETRKNIKRLVQDCDLLSDYLVVKAAKVVRENCDYLRAHDYKEVVQDLEMADANEVPQTMKENTTSRKRSTGGPENAKNTPTKKKNIGNQKKGKRVTSIGMGVGALGYSKYGLVPGSNGTFLTYPPVVPGSPDDPKAPAMLKKLRNSNSLGLGELIPIGRKRNSRQDQLQSETTNHIVNDNREERMVDKTGLNSNKSGIFSDPNALPIDSGKNIVSNASSRLIKELAAYNSPGWIEFEDTGMQTRHRSNRPQFGPKTYSGFDASYNDNQGEQMVNKNIQKAQDSSGFVAMQNVQTVGEDNDVETEYAPGPGTKELWGNGPLYSPDDDDDLISYAGKRGADKGR